MTDAGQPPGCDDHPVNELGCAACAPLRLEHYAPAEPSPSHRQRTDDPPTDEELDEWVKGLRRADYL